MQNIDPQNLFRQFGYTFKQSEEINVENIKIRPIRTEDAYFISELRNMDGIFEYIPSVYSERVSFSQSFIGNLSPETDHVFVAEVICNNCINIIGMAGLHINKNPRQRHCANIGILVHPAHQGKGIGKKLMDKLIDLTDNWLLLKRIELEAVSDNVPAIKLYKKYGFVEEGIKRCYVIKDGEYKDAVLMARVKK